MKVWIIYDSKFGHCKKLAETLEAMLEGECDVSTGYAKKISPTDVMSDLPNAILVGGPIHFGVPSRVITSWVKCCYALTHQSGFQVEKTFAFTTWQFTPNCGMIWEQLLQKYPIATDISPQVLTIRVLAKDHPIDFESQPQICECIDRLKQFLFRKQESC